MKDWITILSHPQKLQFAAICQYQTTLLNIPFHSKIFLSLKYAPRSLKTFLSSKLSWDRAFFGHVSLLNHFFFLSKQNLRWFHWHSVHQTQRNREMAQKNLPFFLKTIIVLLWVRTFLLEYSKPVSIFCFSTVLSLLRFHKQMVALLAKGGCCAAYSENKGSLTSVSFSCL